MKIQLLQPWGGQGIGATIYTDASTGKDLYDRKWANILDPNDSDLFLSSPPQMRIIREFKATITLGANINAYSAGTIILDTGGALAFWDLTGQNIKTSALIVGLRVQTTEASTLAGDTLRFHIYNDSITPIADKTAFVMDDTNTDKRKGHINVTFGTGNLAKAGFTNYENLPVIPVAGKIYFQIEDTAGHTPSANSTVLNCYLRVELGN